MTVSTSTLYNLLQTVHLNQTKVIIPNQEQIENLQANIATKQSELDSKLAILGEKIDQLRTKVDLIITQIIPPETGDFNP